MKNLFSFSLIAILSIFAIVFVGSCSTGPEQSDTSPSQPASSGNSVDHDQGHMSHMGDLEHMDFSKHRSNRTAALIDAYDAISKGLKSEDKAAAADGAKAMIAAFHGFEAIGIDPSKKKETSEIVESAREHAEHITKSELDHQKEHYEEMSADLSDLFDLIDSKGKDK